MKSKIVYTKTKRSNPQGDYNWIKEYSFKGGGNGIKSGILLQCDDNIYRYFSYQNLGNGYTSNELRMIADKMDKLNECRRIKKD